MTSDATFVPDPRLLRSHRLRDRSNALVALSGALAQVRLETLRAESSAALGLIADAMKIHVELVCELQQDILEAQQRLADRTTQGVGR